MSIPSRTPIPPCHLYRYVRAKISPDGIPKRLSYRAPNWRVDLRDKEIQSSLELGCRESLLLFAADSYDALTRRETGEQQRLQRIGSELLMVECVLFAASGSAAYVNPTTSTRDTFDDVQFGIFDSLSLLTLLPDHDLSKLCESRVELYTTATEKPGGLIADVLARVLRDRCELPAANCIEPDLRAPADLSLLLETTVLADKLFETTRHLVGAFVSAEIDADR